MNSAKNVPTRQSSTSLMHYNGLKIKDLALVEDNNIKVSYYLTSDDDRNKWNPSKCVHYIATRIEHFFIIYLCYFFVDILNSTRQTLQKNQ